MKWWAACCCVLCGCGLIPVELGADPAGTDTVIVGSPGADEVVRLGAAGAALAPAARLSLTHPAAAVAIPSNIAPLAFAWRAASTPKPKPKPEDASVAAAVMPEPVLPPPPMAAVDGAVPDMPPMAAVDGAVPDMPPMPDMSEPARAGASAVAYALVLRRGGEDLLRLYTDAAQASFPAAPWRAALAASVGQVLELELRALFEPDHELVRAAPLTIEVRAATPPGAVYAFSTTAQGLVRASLDETRSSYQALGSSDGMPTCTGCHAVSRDGRKLLAAVSGGGGWLVNDVESGELQSLPLPAATDDAEAVFGSFDPSAARIAVTVGGGLFIVDAASGTTLTSASWPGVSVSMPDWSPDGTSIAVSLTSPDDAQAMKPRPRSSDLARIRVQSDGTLAAPASLITPRVGGDTQRVFPSYSPDGRFIAFEQRTGPMAGMGALFVVASEGGTPIALDHASHRGGPDSADAWPSWMPGDRSERPWLMFASTRALAGDELPQGQRQLFATGMDLTLAAAGQDPSSAAFSLPFQAAGDNYRHAVWAPRSRSCVPLVEVCNGVDDDCDGESDEACCDARPERCGDAVDDDCDGISDEGCECTARDVCGDALDNDCDGKLDELVCSGPRPAP